MTLHPWYGPCDGMGTGGECSECERLATPNPPIRPHPELKQEFPGIGPAWLVIAGVAGLVFVFLYVRMVG